MEFTGERFVPECRGTIAAEHYHRYFFASPLVVGKRVLDIASGEGYGTHILAQSAAHVTGVDISEETVAWAAKKYAGCNITFMQGSACAIPLPDTDVDVVVSFETLEHLSQHETMLREIRRVLREDGLLIISTPNKYLYSHCENSFHVKELCREEFVALLERHFAHFTLLGQTVLYGSLLGGAGGATVLLRSREDNVSTDSFTFPDHALYFIALASNGPLPHTDVTFFEYPIEKNDIAIKLQNRLEELQGRYNMLQAQHNALLESNHTTEAHLRDAEAAYAGILASRSWQITSPMRRLRRHFGEFHL